MERHYLLWGGRNSPFFSVRAGSKKEDEAFRGFLELGLGYRIEIIPLRNAKNEFLT